MSYRKWTHTLANQAIPASGTVLTTHRTVWLALIASLLVTPSATCIGSSNSVAGALDGVNRIVTGANIVWAAAGTAHSWIVVRLGGMGGAQLLLTFEGASATGSAIGAFLSPGGLYAGGSATARPTAADELTLLAVASVALPATDGAYALHVPYNSDGSQAYAVLYRGGVAGALWLLSLATLRDAPAAFAKPWIGGWVAIPTGGAGKWTQWGNTGSLKALIAGVSATGFLTCEMWQTLATGTPGQAIWPSSLTGNRQMFPCGFASETAAAMGRHGFLPDGYFADATIGTGAVIALPSGERFAMIDDLAIPWDATQPWITATAPTVVAALAAEIVDLPSVGGGLRVVTTIGSLNVDPNVARWTPIVIEVDTGPNELVTVLVKQGANAALWLTAYDDTLGVLAAGANNFSPLFQARSIPIITGTIAGGRRVNLSILPNGGWQREQVVIVPLVGREQT